MAEETGEANAQGAEDEQAQGAPTDQDDNAQGATDQGGEDVDALRAHITKLERENFDYREERRKREEADETAKQSEGTEVERLTAKVEGLERTLAERDTQAQEQSLRLASITEAQRQGFRNPDLAHRLIDKTKVERDENGEPSNIASLLQDLAKAEPYLLGSSDFGGGPRGASAGSNDDMNARIRSAVGR